jgi:germination protein M
LRTLPPSVVSGRAPRSAGDFARLVVEEVELMRAVFRGMAVIAVVALVAGGCGDDDSTSPTTSPPATDPDTTTTAPPTTEPAEPTPVSVYFLDGEELKVGYVRHTEGLGVAAAALEALLEGPNADDEAFGLHSEIPEGTELLGVNIVDTLATVDLSGAFESGGGTLSMSARLAQVVYTVTQFPSIEGVRFHIDGEPVDSIGGEGLIVDRAITRADFEFEGEIYHLTPAILVESPRPGEAVSGSFRVAGRSNTFEATLNFEVVDPDGEVVIEEFFATATSGTGTPGDFDVTLDIPDGVSGAVLLLAFERSARDGERVNITEIPLRISD